MRTNSLQFLKIVAGDRFYPGVAGRPAIERLVFRAYTAADRAQMLGQDRVAPVAMNPEENSEPAGCTASNRRLFVDSGSRLDLISGLTA